MSEAMRKSLEESDYIFSGMKTFHELKESFPQLMDENGNRKSFERFYNDVRKIDKTYNQHYLKAEYKFAQQSANMAAKWERFEKDGDRYLLQYRTMNDDRVRDTHRALHGVTLPPSDPFWDQFMPPNSWGCRCTVVQVRRGKYEETDHDTAMERGAAATENDKRGMFRFNPGKERKIFPDYNPYTLKKCKTCPLRNQKGKLAKVPISNNELCKVCKVMRQGKKKKAAERIKAFDTKRWEHTYISEKGDGFVVTEHERIKEATASKAEQQKFEKELRQCKIAADNGIDVRYLHGESRAKGNTYDILFDNDRADLKCITGGAGNIEKYTRKAYRQQGAKVVLFELPSRERIYYEALSSAKRKYKVRIVFYFAGEDILKELT